MAASRANTSGKARRKDSNESKNSAPRGLSRVAVAKFELKQRIASALEARQEEKGAGPSARLLSSKGPDLRVPPHLIDYGVQTADRWWDPGKEKTGERQLSFEKDLVLEDGRKVKYVREHRISGDQRKAFFLIDEEGALLALDALSPGILPLYFNSAYKKTTDGPVLFCEGISAADSLSEIGLPAVATLTLDRLPSDTQLAILKERSVILWPDNDDIGVNYMARLAVKLMSSLAEPVKYIRWKEGPAKGDATDFLRKIGSDAGPSAVLDMAEPWRLNQLQRLTQPKRLKIPSSPLFLRKEVKRFSAPITTEDSHG